MNEEIADRLRRNRSRCRGKVNKRPSNSNGFFKVMHPAQLPFPVPLAWLLSVAARRAKRIPKEKAAPRGDFLDGQDLNPA